MARDKHAKRRIPTVPKSLFKEISDYIPEAIFYDEEEMGIAFMIFMTSAVVYVLTMFPGVSGGDSGELITVAKEFGVAHPPGFPLFTLLASCAVNMFSYGSTAWRVNLMSAGIGSVTNVMLYLNVKRFSGNDGAGVLTAGWCGFSRLFWVWSIQGDVFSLNNLMTALLMYVTWRFANAEGNDGKCFEGKLIALIGGLALSNHHSSLLTVIPLLLWVAYTLVTQSALTKQSAFQILLWGLGGLTPYLQLPLSSFLFAPRITWGDHSDMEANDFPRHVLQEVSTMAGYVVGRMNLDTLVNSADRYFEGSCQDLTIVVWILFAVGLIAPYIIGIKKQITIVTVYTTMLAVYLVVFGCYSPSANPRGVMLGLLERYWLQPSVILTTVAGCGLGVGLSYLSALTGNSQILKYSLLTLAVLTASFQVQQNYPLCDESDSDYFYQYSKHVIHSLPKHSILLTVGDVNTNTLRYHTIGEEYRTDVMVMDMNFMSGRWFYTKLMPVNWPDVSFPGYYKPGNSSEYPFYNLRQFLDLNYDRFPVFVCKKVSQLEDSLEGVYEAWPHGMCQKLVRIAAEEDIFAHLEKAPLIDLDVFRLPDLNRYGPKTWEYNIMAGMLQTFTKAPTWLNEKAGLTRDPDYKLRCFTKAMEILEGYRNKVLNKIEEGELSADMVHYIATVEYQLGQFTMALYILETDDEKKAAMVDKILTHWRNYVDWQRDDVEVKVGNWEMVLKVLEEGNFDGLYLSL